MDGEQNVLCPFLHPTPTGEVYYESNPSAFVNLTKGLFYCHSCNRGYNEVQFIEELFGCNFIKANHIVERFNNPNELEITTLAWKNDPNLILEEQTKQKLIELGISLEVAEQLNIVSLPKDHPERDLNDIFIPITMYEKVIGYRTYRKGKNPKVLGRKGLKNGFIIPFDLWINSDKRKSTLICAGEKDMLVARSHGFNAITITGGELSEPINLKQFTDIPVAIVYDNDEGGKTGAVKLALALYKYTKKIKVVLNFHEVCKEPKEDITDFFVKYNKTREDLVEYIKKTPYFEPTNEEYQKVIPNVNLMEASKPQYLDKLLYSNIQVVAAYDTTFSVPTQAYMKKIKRIDDNDKVEIGKEFFWELEEQNIGDMLKLIDNNLQEGKIEQTIKEFMHIPLKEYGLTAMQYKQKETVFKVQVTDLFETSDEDELRVIEYTAYCYGCLLESGKKYSIKYKIVPHPFRGRQLIMIILDAKEANDSVTSFRLNDITKSHLDEFINLEGSVEERMHLLTEKVKGLLNYDGNNQLIEMIDLVYHSVLYFNFKNYKKERGCLDAIIVGESRVGKSSTANALRETYKLGAKASLAGNSATIAGIVGGSVKIGNAHQTKAGLIPQNDKGLIIFEELGKSKSDIIQELTEIRSSNQVRIVRVSGILTLPAMARYISFSNPKTFNGNVKSIESYPNGIEILLDLIPTAEDIARYDVAMVLSDKGSSQIDINWEPQEPFKPEVYQSRIRWVWSRKAHQIILNGDVQESIIQLSNKLNSIYGGHIKIFGTETWKKLTRLTIAIAGYLVSTDSSYENIVIDVEHVQYAVKLLTEMYDNPTFKLRQYITNEKRYSVFSEEDKSILLKMRQKFSTAIDFIDQHSEVSKGAIASASGLEPHAVNGILKELIEHFFIKMKDTVIMPTEKFRKVYKEISHIKVAIPTLANINLYD